MAMTSIGDSLTPGDTLVIRCGGCGCVVAGQLIALGDGDDELHAEVGRMICEAYERKFLIGFSNTAVELTGCQCK